MSTAKVNFSYHRRKALKRPARWGRVVGSSPGLDTTSCFIMPRWTNLAKSLPSKGRLFSVRIRGGVPVMEDDAAGMVLRPALNTGFSEMGWGSTPPSSAKVL